MSSPSPNHVTIRLELSVPTGVNINVGKGGPVVGGLFQLFFNLVGNPATGQPYNTAFPNICVQRVEGSSLGSVPLFFTYTTAQFAVTAISAPAALDAASPTPHPSAQPGQPSSGGTVWTWDGLRHADSAPTHDTARNIVRLWTKATSTSDWEPDSNTFSYYGYSGPDSPCGSGSGSGSGSGGGTGSGGTHGGRPALLVRAADGPLAGTHPATPVGALRWEVAVKGVVYRVDFAHDGTAAFLSGPNGSIRARTAGQNPFFAIFCGAEAGSTADLMVYQE